MCLLLLLSCKPTSSSSKSGGLSGSSERSAPKPKVLAPEVLADGSIITTRPDGTRYFVIEPLLKRIKKKAFQNKGLDSVEIPNRIVGISARVFANNRLTSVQIPPNVQFIKQGLFQNNQLTHVTIGSNVQYIAQSAFRGNRLTSLTIDPNVRRISFSAFSNNRLTSLIIHAPTIANNAFSNNRLTRLILSPSVLYIYSKAFVHNQLVEGILPKHLHDRYAAKDVFANNPASMAFYEYDERKADKKGRKLN